MNKNAWTTHYDISKLIHPMSLNEYQTALARYYQSPDQVPILSSHPKAEAIRLFLEIKWMKAGRPYYNIREYILPSVGRMRLDNIPANMLDTPMGIVNIRMPDSFSIKSILVGRMEQEGIGLCSLLQDGQGVLTTSIPQGLTENIEHLVDTMTHHCSAKYVELQKTVFRTFVLVKFLNNVPNDELMEYDVANRYTEEYKSCSAERRSEIEKRSRDLGKPKGYNIGVSERILGAVGRLSEQRELTDTGRELEHAHIRTGHLHCVRFGTKKEKVKVIWYRPTIIRPDLPFK